MDKIDRHIVSFLSGNPGRWCDVREVAAFCNPRDRERTRQPTRARLTRLLIEENQPIASGVRGFKWAQTRSDFDGTIEQLTARTRGLVRRIRAVVRARDGVMGDEQGELF